MLGCLVDAVEPELVEQVETIAGSVPEVQSVDRLRLRWLGHALEASMAITVDCHLAVAEGHRVSREVRHRLVHEVRRFDTAVIHVNPCGRATAPLGQGGRPRLHRRPDVGPPRASVHGPDRLPGAIRWAQIVRPDNQEADLTAGF